MGKESFRKGIQEYLKTYAYGNATWEGLIGILDTYTDDDLSGWSHIWVNEKGMPEIAVSIVGDSLVVSQKDPFGRGLNWPQDLTYLIVPKNRGTGRNFSFFREKFKFHPEEIENGPGRGEFHYSEYGWKRVWLFPVERSGCQGLCRLSFGL